ncbi:hypothetical protein CQA53_09360 [Helicobacter didelphidarum]|uniref:Multifunctional fusion protein n=1 Tax=Helicobacter didelphidarum TaxID=2040648 RepID=A0A3D8IB91_9HELI|nr:16S rRNA (cytosine(1402)-N(4))-methyltransferase RsmH [Helicobacter didelphidarum]RDU62402.1 hypothetical protein CQA53_09360 [Helicobacter didelphidarum]
MIFGIDFGLKRIGLAKILNGIILPLPAIIRKNRNQASKELRKILLQHTGQNDMKNIQLVIGIPYHESLQDSFMNDTQNTYHKEMKCRITHFLALIEFDGKVIFIDESFSSKEAEEKLQDRGYKKRQKSRKNGILDSLSACIILERYITMNKNLQENRDIEMYGKYRENIQIKNLESFPTRADVPSKDSHLCNNNFQNLKDFSMKSKLDSIHIKKSQIIIQNQNNQHQNDSVLKKDSPHIPVLLQEVLETFDRILNKKNKDFLLSLESNKQKFRLRKQQYNIYSKKQQNTRINKTIQDKCDIDFQNNPHATSQDSLAQDEILQCEKPLLIDCTLGFGGMSGTLLETYKDLHIIGIDRDDEAISYNTNLQEQFGDRLEIYHGSFAQVLPQLLEHITYENNLLFSHATQKYKKDSKTPQLRAILADIGVSSYQLDTLSRGFSFHSNILDMRMDTTQMLNADFILNHYSRFELERIFREYGEIREYKKLAHLIVQAREYGEITHEILHNLSLKIRSKSKLHPLTLIFQALRIEVNDELGQLQKLLHSCENLKGVLLCIISFHSLEDRIIKETFKRWARTCICPASNLRCECGNNNALGKILYKKPLSANLQELKKNPRARSAKLRAFYFFE